MEFQNFTPRYVIMYVVLNRTFAVPEHQIDVNSYDCKMNSQIKKICGLFYSKDNFLAPAFSLNLQIE